MFILVNLKAYPCDPIEVSTAARDVAEASGARIGVAPQAADLARVAETGVETWAQHVSPNAHGSHTGSTLAEAVADNGAAGTLTTTRRIASGSPTSTAPSGRRSGPG